LVVESEIDFVRELAVQKSSKALVNNVGEDLVGNP
jgi:hypothetical protein